MESRGNPLVLELSIQDLGKPGGEFSAQRTVSTVGAFSSCGLGPGLCYVDEDVVENEVSFCFLMQLKSG